MFILAIPYLVTIFDSNFKGFSTSKKRSKNARAMNVSNDEQQQHNKQTTQNNKNEIGRRVAVLL